jgi:hypothetical protein
MLRHNNIRVFWKERVKFSVGMLCEEALIYGLIDSIINKTER